MKTLEALHNYPVVRQEDCVAQHGCKNCMLICPERAIKAIHIPSHLLGRDGWGAKEKVASIEHRSCERCGLCYQVCPTGAIEDGNARDYREKALSVAGKDKVIIFACEHTDFNSELHTLSLRAEGEAIPVNGIASGLKPFAMTNSKLIPVPDISIVSWRDIFKVMSMGSPVVMIGCGDCRQTGHFRQMESIFASSYYEGAFRFFERGGENIPSPLAPHPLPLHGGGLGWGSGEGAILDEDILEQIIASYTGRIPFPGTAWVDIGKRCTLCQNCARVCPTGALWVKSTEGKTVLLYDHSLCRGCPICEKACPERCITIDRRLRLDRLFAIEKKGEKEILFCRGCDKPTGTDAVLERVRSILIAHGQGTEHLEYCPECKGQIL